MSEQIRQDAAPNAERLFAELQFLSELCQVMASNTELQPILDWIVAKTTAMLSADEGSIRLLGNEAEGPSPKTFIRKQSQGIESGSWPVPIAMSVMGYLLHRGEHLASPDLCTDERFPGLRGVETRIRSVLAVPLRVGNRVTGILAVTQQSPGRQWSTSDVQLLAIVASNSAGAIEQARLRHEEIEKQRLEEERRRLEREFNQAREIQMNLVPSHPIRHGGWEVCGRVVPAKQVGGDSFDYFAIDQHRVGLAIADVSGKGFPAALLMMNMQGTLRALCDGRRTIPEAIAQINQSIVRSATGKFITMFYAEMDTQSGTLRFTNAGHNYPLLRRADGSVEELKDGGLPLGLFDGAEYGQGEVSLAAGDALMLYSDGISEAVDLRQNEYGEERLLALWREHGGGTPESFIGAAIADVERFRGAAPQSDDMTVVVMSATPNA